MRVLLSLLAAASLVTGCDAGDAAPGTARDGATVPALGQLAGGDPLPEATLPELDGDGALSTTELVGQPAVLNFWATWCAFCVEEMPALEQVHDEVGDRVRFVGIDREDSHEEARTLAERTGVSYTLVTDDDGSFFRALEARGMPTTVLVDAEGTVVHRHAGPVTVEELRALIAEHLDVSASSPAPGA